MPTIMEGNLTFQFPNAWQATKFDQWSFYRNQFQSVCGGAKAIDILALAPDGGLWTIEIKDYRQQRRTKPSQLAEEVACKVRDSLAALVAAKINANDPEEKRLAQDALTAQTIRVILHLEQPAKPSKLFPHIDPAHIHQKLKQLIKAIDPHPCVLESTRMKGMAWTVS